MDGVSVVDRLNKISDRLRETCRSAGRTEDSVRLLAVSKFHDVRLLKEAIAQGQRDFAENYVQEACGKISELGNEELRWHFIGRIQSNKVKYLIGKFHAIHSVDRLPIAQLLNRLSAAQGVVQKIFLQYNVAEEDSKAGADRAELESLFEYCSEAANLSVQGLMVMPPLRENAEDSRPYFVKARLTLESLRARLSEGSRAKHPCDQLSMGTSGDFEVAVAEGATWVRLGTQIFGPRSRPNQEESV